MDSTQFFINDLKNHKEKVKANMDLLIREIEERASGHDNDKMENKIIFDTYAKHCQKQRSLKYGSYEREKLENGEAMGKATTLHVKNNRHHFYDNRNELTFENVDLLDMLEALSDWLAAISRDELNEEETLKRLLLVLEKHSFPELYRKLIVNTYKNYLKK